MDISLSKGNDDSTTIDDNPDSPIAPSPEPLSPVLEERKCESTTYRLVYTCTCNHHFCITYSLSLPFPSCFVNLISDDEAEWVQDPAVQLILQSSNEDKESR